MRSLSGLSGRRLAPLLLVPLVVVLLGNGGAPGADETLAAVREHYRSIRDFRARFVQVSLVASLGREEVSAGHVVVRRPGKMRWEYSEPEHRLVVSDGETLKIWLPSERQMQVASLAGGAVSPTALGLLLGESDLARTFHAERIEASRPDELGLRLVPRSDATFESLDVWVEAGTHRLRASQVKDLFGNVTRLRFEDIVENGGVEEAEFTIEVPEGTDVIDLRQ